MNLNLTNEELKLLGNEPSNVERVPYQPVNPQPKMQTETRPINQNNQPTNPISLYEALRIGYLRDENKQEKELKRFGYTLDKGLTNYDHVTAFNPETKKLLYIVNGTAPHRLADLATDFDLATGKLKETPRYKSDKREFDKALSRYDEKDVAIAGHSLGGAISSYLSGNPDHKIYTFNAASTFGQKIRPNEESFRTRNDQFSALKAGARLVPQTVKGIPILAEHDLKNIRDQKIYL